MCAQRCAAALSDRIGAAGGGSTGLMGCNQERGATRGWVNLFITLEPRRNARALSFPFLSLSLSLLFLFLRCFLGTGHPDREATDVH